MTDIQQNVEIAHNSMLVKAIREALNAKESRHLELSKNLIANQIDAVCDRIPDERITIQAILSDLEVALCDRIKGQDELLRVMLMSLVLNDHALLEGLPGVGKTEIVKWLAVCTGLPFSRVQFIPDMLPSDLIGRNAIDIIKLQDEKQREQAERWVNGPIFSSIVLADEINRAPSKVQAALLEAMGEKQVTPLGHTSRPLFSPIQQAAMRIWQKHAGNRGLLGFPGMVGEDRRDLAPFTVFATMNPIEQEGTYPLSEAQMDRFCFKTHVPYPPRSSYLEIAQEVYSGDKPPEAMELRHSVEEFEAYFKENPGHVIPVLLPVYFLILCRAHIVPVKVGDHLCCKRPTFGGKAETTEQAWVRQIYDVVYMTNARTDRVGEGEGSTNWYSREQIELRSYLNGQNANGDEHKARMSRVLAEEHTQYIKSGASPRGFLKLLSAAACHAFIEGRDPDVPDILAVIDNVLRHRIHMDVHARLAGMTSEEVIHKVSEIILG